MSLDIETETLCWLRYVKRLPLVCTEAGPPWYPDVIGLSKEICIEVEIKRSRADLLAEFRNKDKHAVYLAGGKSGVPNYYYFMVPAKLEKDAVEIVSEKFPKAGVAVFEEPERPALDGRNIRIAKKPVKLHDVAPSQRFLDTAQMRLSSELCGMHIAKDHLAHSVENIFREAVKEMRHIALVRSGHLDSEDPETYIEACRE
jgi:hypothetical protein